MPRVPKLPIKRLTSGKWQLYIPESVTGTGKPRRPSFETKALAMEHRDAVLKDQGVLRMHSQAEPADMADTAKAKELLARAGVTASMSDLARFYIGHNSRIPITVSELFRSYAREKLAHRSSVYRKQALGWLLKLQRALKDDTQISSISPAILRAAVEKSFPKIPAAYFNKVRGTLAPAWTFAVKRDWVSTNPWDKIERREHTKSDAAIYTVAQARDLLVCCSKDVLPYWAMATFAGIRPEELRKLQWSDVNLTQSRIIIRREVSKTRKPRVVEISPNLTSILKPLISAGPVTPQVNTRKLIEAPKRNAGLVGLGNDIARHSFASYHLAAHNDLNRLRASLGHETPEVTLTHYYDLVMPEESEEFWGILEARQP